MTIHIALLRSTSAGGRQITGDQLTGLLVHLGLEVIHVDAKINALVFDSGERTGADLQAQLETELQGRLALRTDVYVRSDQAWKALIAANPFPEFAAGDPGRLMVQFLKDTPDKKHVGALRAAVRGLEQIRAESRQLYMTYPDGVSGSKLTNNLVEKTLGERVTARSWTTVLALDAAMEQPA
jgi:uncharacterized protein (DUF1697 family)